MFSSLQAISTSTLAQARIASSSAGAGSSVSAVPPSLAALRSSNSATSTLKANSSSSLSRTPTSSAASATPLAASQQQTRKNSTTRGNGDGDGGGDDADWAFGGGSMSQSGPWGAGARTSGPIRFGTGLHNYDQGSYQQPPATAEVQNLGIVGNAGKGATPNYGRKKRIVKPKPDEVPDDAAQDVGAANRVKREKADREFAAGYVHKYAPSTRSPDPLPQHTYFSSPSSSFNASSFVAPGTAPPLSRVLSAAGVGEYLPGGVPKRKKTAVIMAGQGSQYIGMGKNMYKTFRSARAIWHTAEEALLWTPGRQYRNQRGPTSPFGAPFEEYAKSSEQRELFEEELAKTAHWDPKQGFAATGTAVTRGKRGWLRDLVFSGDQLDLTRAENAQPAILTCTMAFLTVLKEEFNVDLVADHMDTAAGHGTGNYATMVAAGVCDLTDAVRLLRHRGLTSSHFLAQNPVLFPPGCKPPLSVYETWGFSNAGSGKGATLLNGSAGLRSGTRAVQDEEMNETSTMEGLSGHGWRRSQMSGVVLKPGKLQAALAEVERVAADIKAGRVPEFHPDEFVEVANYNSSLQIVLAGTKLGVSYACDRLRAKGLGARAVNLPVSGPYHTSIMKEAADFLKPAVEYLPLRDPCGLELVSSFSGAILPNVQYIRDDLSGAFARPVRWHHSIETMVLRGVERFICLGPGRACAHLLSKELAYRDRLARADHEAGRAPPPQAEFEVWSVASVEDVLQLGGVLDRISAADGRARLRPQIRDDVIAL
ncbi:FabD/lysophospholipase-like protein [Tilletiaria anomala UBC 951]|uniref:[acyl-carrier-protein] S-malonyltransferase n=1 Tax=Tilletiaria anomala (strain ATCC 24038 / CBS 436.72 / UBC 951) TaxID=1037660 RepID=A0A066V977_TILAU|nr:FabD/lysophospholipase-like protein [Tilletiaria anomala UBC 951]KDN38036.1 FabD/lysophospholipase-like protein [Tilletiaria anomala UBC 951]